jgi:hypothetical protein
MYDIYLLWTDFKTNIISQGVQLNYELKPGGYNILVQDKNIIWKSNICTSEDIEDFESNYKMFANKEPNVLDIVHEEKDIPEESEDTEYKFSVPEKEVWIIDIFGGSASINNVEIEFSYSDDNGETWKHPSSSSSSEVIRSLHLTEGNSSSCSFRNPIRIVGGNNIFLRFIYKNFNEYESGYERKACITAWINGSIYHI